MKNIDKNSQKRFIQQTQNAYSGQTGSGTKIVTKSKPVLIMLFSVFVLSLTLSIFMLFNPVFIVSTTLTSNADGTYDFTYTDTSGTATDGNICTLNFTYSSESETATIKSSTFTVDITNLEIPESITVGVAPDAETYAVTIISDFAFYSKTNLKGSLSIPDRVTSISNSAFSGCSGLTSITIPNSVMNIGGSAFSGCSGLASLNVAQDNTRYKSVDNCILSKDGTQLIVGCKNSTIPDSVTSIGDSAFSGCSELTRITISNSVTSIGGFAFYGCSGLTSMTIPNRVTSIGSSAFYGCSGLTSLRIPNSVNDIEDFAFSGCRGLTSIIIPNSVTSIGQQAFSGCRGLTGVLTIPNSVTSIGAATFYYCSGLTSIIIPKV